jgi:LmbE family N-acetylglucosaminyl deacetylase
MNGMTSARPSLLAVFAHPDDELFYAGVLADCAAHGGRVTLSAATMGDAGRVLDPTMGPVEDVAALRAAELQRACEAIGIDPPRFLGFRDSGRGDRLRRDDPRALVNVDFLDIVRAVVDLIGEVRPQVVLTHEPLGGYYHPDHIVVHRAVTAAFFASGALGGDAPARLLYGAASGDAFRHFAHALSGRGVADGLDPDLFGIAPEMVALSFDARPYARHKRAALAAHRSQFGLTLDNMADPPPGRPAAVMAAFGPLLDREIYLLGGTRTALPHWPLAAAFDGLSARSPRQRRLAGRLATRVEGLMANSAASGGRDPRQQTAAGATCQKVEYTESGTDKVKCTGSCLGTRTCTLQKRPAGSSLEWTDIASPSNKQPGQEYRCICK